MSIVLYLPNKCGNSIKNQEGLSTEAKESEK